MALKQIKPEDVEMVAADKVREGDILAGGIVLDIREGEDKFYFETSTGTVWIDATDEAQVYGRLAFGMVDSLRKAVLQAV